MPVQTKDTDAIIAEAFIKVKEGLLTKDWELVSDAYELISGERIEVEPQDRLEKIRSMMGGVQEERPRKKSKTKKVTSKISSEFIDPATVREEKTDSGLIIVTTDIDEEEAEINERFAQKKMNMPVKRSAPPKDNSKDENAAVRFYNENRSKPQE
jgi:hypothetical protein